MDKELETVALHPALENDAGAYLVNKPFVVLSAFFSDSRTKDGLMGKNGCEAFIEVFKRNGWKFLSKLFSESFDSLLIF